MPSEITFPQHRLDAYRASVDLLVACDRIARSLPRGYGKLTDNLVRASVAVPLLIGEGANRFTDGQKRQRYTEARGECGECAVALEIVLRLQLAPRDEVEQALVLASRTGSMLTGLVKRFARGDPTKPPN